MGEVALYHQIVIEMIFLFHYQQYVLYFMSLMFSFKQNIINITIILYLIQIKGFLKIILVFHSVRMGTSGSKPEMLLFQRKQKSVHILTNFAWLLAS